MTPPTEDEVRMALMVLGNALGSEAQHLSIASAIATIETALDEVRKDRERLEWVLCWLLDKHWTVGHLLGGDVAEMTTAIDQARGA